MSNVVMLPRSKKPGNLEDIDFDYTKLVRAFINRLVREYIRDGGKIKTLSLKSGIGTQTISRLAYYETARPTWHTVMAVLTAMEAMAEFADLTMRYAKKNTK